MKMNMIETGLNKKGQDLSNKKINSLIKQVSKIEDKNTELNAVANEIIALDNSSQIYDVKVNFENGAGELTYDNSSGFIVINISQNSKNQLATFAHEAKHAYQYETGKVSLMFSSGKGGSLVDITDEVEAYKRGQLFGANLRSQITEKWVRKQSSGYNKLPSGPIDINTPTNNPLFPSETYGQAIHRQNQLRKSVGQNPIQVIK